jgi:hypothetical protein
MRYRKKPVVIEAMQFVAGGQDLIARWMIGHDAWDQFGVSGDGVQISTLEGVMTANPGDWIIRGIKGEFYPCKSDIFTATYEAAE